MTHLRINLPQIVNLAKGCQGMPSWESWQVEEKAQVAQHTQLQYKDLVKKAGLVLCEGHSE
jgi:hypothetical protein